jgi:hypothetical protein
MESSFTLTIDWLAFTVLASNPQETMRVLGGDWSRAKGWLPRLSVVLDEGRRSARGGQIGHERPSASE